MAGGPDLLAQTQDRYFTEHSGALNSLINSLVSENWLDVVKNCDVTCWKEVLIGVFTHTSPEERSALCGKKKVYEKVHANSTIAVINIIINLYRSFGRSINCQ